MKTEGLFLCSLKKSRTGQDVAVTLKDIEIPDSIAEIFQKSDEIVAQLGSNIQQIYYTVGRVKLNGQKRVGVDQKYAFFDLDYVIQNKKQEYIKIFCEHFKLDVNKTAVVDSGYGLQFIIELEHSCNEKDFAEANKNFHTHKRLLELKLEDSGLIGTFETYKGPQKTHFDTAVFRLASLARLPFTINHDPKKERETRKTSLIQGNLEPQAKSLGALLQTDLKGDEDAPSTGNLKVDGEYVKAHCGLLKWALNTPEKIHEKDFFFTVGLLKRCYDDESEGEKACLEWFKLVREKTESPTVGSYSEKKALEKIIRTQPATYKKLIAHYGEEMFKSDPGYPRHKHPLQMHSPDFIETEGSGFRFPPPPGKQYRRMDHSGLVKYFKKKKGYFVSEISEPQKTLYYFDKTHYKVLHPAEALEFALEHVVPEPSKDERSEFLSRVALENMQDLNQLFFEKTDGFVNTESGIVNIKSGELLPHSHDFGFSYVLPYKYDPSATCPLWESTVAEYMKGCEENIEILQMYGGYVLAGGSCKAQAVLILTGEGQNGKSVYWKLLAKLLGWVEGGAFSPMKEPEFERPHALANLRTKLMCVIEEPEPYLKSSFWESIKDYSAGGVISGSLKFKNQIEFENRAKFIISMNQFASGTAQTFGFLRRLKIVHFPHIIPDEKRIHEFEDRLLREEGSGILNWFMEGYRKLEKIGFKFPTTKPMEASLEEYKINTNMVYAFSHEIGIEHGNPSDKGFATGDLDVHYLDGNNSGMLRDKLYEKYADFVKAQFPESDSHRYKIEAKNKFSQKLRQYFKFEEKRVGGRGSQRYVLVGIRIKNVE